jgi:3-oxoacyl-[acyl-carrier protein] reductase
VTEPLTGEVALVSGGSRGVGGAVVRRLAAAGAQVAFSYRRDVEAARAVADELAASGRSARAYPADLAVQGAASGLVEAVTADIGAPSIFVSNAGTASRGYRALDTDPGEYQAMFAIHVLAALEAARAVAQGMRKAGRGKIVFVSSTTTTVRPPGSAPYTAAKAALEAAASVLAIEEREHGIRINVVAPGLVATDMGDRLVRASSLSAAGGRAGAAVDLDTAFPFGRVCRPEDVADVVAFLVGNSSSYVAGHRVVVDGGGAAGALLPTSQS